MLEPDRSEYSPIINRPIVKWPNNARVALWVAPNVEYVDFIHQPNDGKGGFYRGGPGRSPMPDVRSYGNHDYGNRIGIWRMMEVFDHHKIRCTVSLNEAILEHFPETKEAMLKRNYDFMSHGIYNSRYLNHLSIEEERAFFKDCVDTLKKHTGKQLKGMLAPAVQPSVNTPDLMAEAGLIYATDWYHDDQPFPMKVKQGKLISVPYSMEINDVINDFQSQEAEYFGQIVKDQFDVLYEEGAESGRVMCIAVHPYWIGQPHRIKYLDDALGYIMSHDGVWQTTADEIAEYYIANYYDQVQAHVEQQKQRGLV